MKNGKLRFKESIKNILSFIYVLNVFIIIPMELLSYNLGLYIIVLVKIILGAIIIERTNLFEEV